MTMEPDISLALIELERRKKANPHHMYEPANDKCLNFHKSKAKIRALFGGNRCVHGDTLIYDPVKRENVKVRDYKGGHVLAFDGNRFVVAEATKSTRFEPVDLYEVITESGKRITVSEGHRFLSSEGWIDVHNLRPIYDDSRIACLQNPVDSISEPFQSTQLSGVRSFWSKLRDCLDRCSVGFYQCGVRLREVLDTCRVFLPLPAGVPEHNLHCSQTGEFSEGYRYNHFYQLSSRHSKTLISRQIDPQRVQVEDRGRYIPFEWLLLKCQGVLRFLGTCIPAKLDHEPYSVPRLSNDVSLNNPPMYSFICRQYTTKYEKIQSIEFKGRDYYYDIHVPVYENYVANGIVNHNSSKTETAVMECVYRLTGEHPYQNVPKAPIAGRIVVVDYNQLEKVVLPKLMRMLPPALLIDGKWDRSYSDKKHMLKLRNGSTVDFMTHIQPILAFEGSSLDFVLFDEEPTKDIYTSCMMRLVDRNGIAMFAMTPLNGLTFTYTEIYLASFTSPNIDCFVMSTYENRYLTREAIEEIEGLVVDETDRQIRLHGRFTSRAGLVLSNFDPELHIYKPEDYEDEWDGIYPPKYFVHVVGIDPGWGHATGVIWTAMNPRNYEKFVYMEHKEAGQDPVYHSKVIKSANMMMGRVKPVYVIDSQAKAKEHSSGSNSYRVYAKQHIVCRLGTKKLVDGNMRLNMALKPQVVNSVSHAKCHISSECVELVSEIGMYQKAPETSIQNRERFIDKNNDLIAAWRYANYEMDKLNYEDMEDILEESGYFGETIEHIRQGSKLCGY